MQNDTRPIIFQMFSTGGTEWIGGAPTVLISQNGGPFVSPVGEVTEIGYGFYALMPAGTDVATLGPGRLRATQSGASNAYAEFQVIAQDPYVAISASFIGGAVWGYELTEGYSTFGTPGSYTAAAIIWDMRQRAYNVKIVGTTMTITKTDGATAAHTIQLDNALTPTQGTQAS
jgi:hypothetical protein